MNPSCDHRLLVLSLALLAGCADSGRDRLIGTWRGRPQSAEDRNARLISGDAAAPNAAPQSDDAARGDAAAVGVGDDVDGKLIWEHFDFGVRLKFGADGNVEMSLDDGSQPIVGNWRVADESSDRMIIEIEVASPRTDSRQAEDERPHVERRRFGLRWHGNGRHDQGFSLDHENANPRLGSLYFQRIDG